MSLEIKTDRDLVTVYCRKTSQTVEVCRDRKAAREVLRACVDNGCDPRLTDEGVSGWVPGGHYEHYSGVFNNGNV